MSLQPGQSLTHHRLVEKIGEGGMGVVWKAHDGKLDRDVAVKILPAEFSEDKQRLARFEREAKLLAALNHPNIASIHGLEETDDVHFIVMELVPGETLAEMRARGPLPLGEAIDLSAQIAEALEAAHRSGVIHRDLKPANIKVTPEGKVKILDFGLAKALDTEPSGSAAEVLSHSPTVTQGATRAGVILGTAAYMSPEQARGKPVDRRADNWAFGCILYEMLTGKQAFHGETVSDTIAAILRGQVDWEALPSDTPSSVRRLLRRCLEKNPDARLRDIGDARIEIDEAEAERSGPSIAVAERDQAPPRGTGRRRALTWGVAGLFLGAILTGLAVRIAQVASQEPPRVPFRFVMSLPSDAPIAADSFLCPIALSPDGDLLAYVGVSEGVQRLYIRPRDRLEASALPGTEGAEGPFFSPDGRWIGFYAGGKLKKVSAQGGLPQEICDLIGLRGATWGADDTIIFPISSTERLFKVSAGGGTPEPFTTFDASRGEYSHRFPQFLPGGDTLIFSAPKGTNVESAPIWAYTLETGERRLLLEGGADARYVPSGHLLFVQAGSLMAAPFDPMKLEVTGPPVAVIDGVIMQANTGAGYFATADDGTLVYLPGGLIGTDRELAWVDRQGEATPFGTERHAYRWPRLSPDGRRVVTTVIEGRSRPAMLYLIDATGDAPSLFTYERGAGGLWSPDGQRIAFSSDRTGVWNLYVRPVDGSRPAERLIASDMPQIPTSWSPDGAVLAFTEYAPASKGDMWMLSMEGEPTPRPFLKTSATEGAARFSPDGKWIAYVSDESGQYEVYVTAHPEPGGKWQVSAEGGTEPVWAPDGRELYYRSGRKMMAVAVETDPVIKVSTPRVLFEGPHEGLLGTLDFANYAVAPDGQRFVMVRGPQEGAERREVTVVLNWFEDLERRMAEAE